MKIFVAGDLTMQGRAAFLNWDTEDLQSSFSSIKELISKSNHSIVNLESPVTSCSVPILKDGPALKSTPTVFKIIKYCGFDTVTLANNHIRDYGSKGVLDTVSACNREGIASIGVGKNLSAARRACIYEDNCVSVGIINVCEHESSIATDENAGANPLDLVNLFYDIRKLKNQVDTVIVIIHGGREHYQLPTPRMKRVYHLIIDYGADVVINHHQHCLSGYELYSDRPIFYGLGNFFFDRSDKQNDKWNRGLLLQLDIRKGKIDFNLIPFVQCSGKLGVYVANDMETNEELKQLNCRLRNDSLLKDDFSSMALSARPLWPFLPFGLKIHRALYFRKLFPSLITRRKMALIKNSISCETHREVLLHFLEKRVDNE